MYAVKLDTAIPHNRHLVIQLPNDVPIGDAEVIILSKPKIQQGNGQALLRFLRERRLPPQHRRSAAEIDAQIEQERHAWD